MERDSEYGSFLVNTPTNISGGESSSDEPTAFNDMFSGISLLSLLTTTATADLRAPPTPLLSPSSSSAPTTMQQLFGHPFSSPSPSASLGFDLAGLSFLKSPKPEPPPPQPFGFAVQRAGHLPDLLSFEHTQPPAANKRARADPPAEIQHKSHRLPEPAPQISPPIVAPGGMVPRGSALQRQRRQRLSEKTRCLQRVLPWDKKMDLATMLEETYKYVKFLEAQLSALSAMPEAASGGGSSSDRNGSDVFGGLGRLSRNQLLQVLVNSPVAQTTLYSKGCCVFSVEQLGLIQKAAQMRRIRTTNFLLPNPFSSF